MTSGTFIIEILIALKKRQTTQFLITHWLSLELFDSQRSQNSTNWWNANESHDDHWLKTLLIALKLHQWTAWRVISINFCSDCCWPTSPHAKHLAVTWQKCVLQPDGYAIKFKSLSTWCETSSCDVVRGWRNAYAGEAAYVLLTALQWC